MVPTGIIDSMSVWGLAGYFYDLFNRTADDLNLDTVYTKARCLEIAEMTMGIRRLARERKILLFSHYYTRPEIQKTCHFVGDSLGLGLKAHDLISQNKKVSAVWLSAVRFMGDTMKIILNEKVPVYMPRFSGCSLVASLDGLPFDFQRDSESNISAKLMMPKSGKHLVEFWLEDNPGGIILSYMNSDPESKARSWAVFTSRNAMKVLENAMRENPGERVYILPDQFLSNFILHMAKIKKNPWIKPELVDVFNGLCHVHAQKINSLALDQALSRYPKAALVVHPECGCAVDCFIRVASGGIPRPTFIGSTQEMIDYAHRPDTPDEIIIATETGHVFTLRDKVPTKTFYPVSHNAICEFMKATTLEDLWNAVNDPDWSNYEINLSPDTIKAAKTAIDRMLKIV